jgi:transketolase
MTPGELAKGAYVLSDFGEGEPELILMASGSEVSLVYEAAARLAAEGAQHARGFVPVVGVVRGQQDQAYREAGLAETHPEAPGCRSGSRSGLGTIRGLRGRGDFNGSVWRVRAGQGPVRKVWFYY